MKKEAQKLYADSTRKEHEIKKSMMSLKALEDKVSELKRVSEQTKKNMAEQANACMFIYLFSSILNFDLLIVSCGQIQSGETAKRRNTAP